MSKLEGTVARKNSLRRYERETLERTGFETEAVFKKLCRLWVVSLNPQDCQSAATGLLSKDHNLHLYTCIQMYRIKPYYQCHVCMPVKVAYSCCINVLRLNKNFAVPFPSCQRNWNATDDLKLQIRPFYSNNSKVQQSSEAETTQTKNWEKISVSNLPPPAVSKGKWCTEWAVEGETSERWIWSKSYPSNMLILVQTSELKSEEGMDRVEQFRLSKPFRLCGFNSLLLGMKTLNELILDDCKCGNDLVFVITKTAGTCHNINDKMKRRWDCVSNSEMLILSWYYYTYTCRWSGHTCCLPGLIT